MQLNPLRENSPEKQTMRVLVVQKSLKYSGITFLKNVAHLS